MKKDQEIFDLIKAEGHRQRNGIELIASENFVSDEVMQATGSCLTNKYAEGYPRKRYYGGCEVVDKVEQLAIDRAKELFGVEYVNVQPHSGSQANAAVMLACLNPGDKILGFNLSHGGHLTHGSPVNFSGKLYSTSFYSVEEESGKVDYDKLEETAIVEKPQLIICGASAYSQDWDYKRFREISDKVGALLMADIAHPAGLIAAKLLNDPALHCHILTTTTHKTLRGPRGGMIMMGKDFENTILRNVDFQFSQLIGIDFRQSLLEDINFYQTMCISCNFDGINIKSIKTLTSLSFNNFPGSSFRDADFKGWDYHKIDFTAKVSEEDQLFVRGAILSNADFSGMDLTRMVFSRNGVTDYQSQAQLDNANLSQSDLSSIDLRYVMLSNANLEGANLEGATMTCFGHDLCTN